MVASVLDPAHRMLLSHLRDARFRMGVLAGRWGFPDGVEPDSAVIWPHLLVWVSAPERAEAPARYYFRFDCTDYPAQPVTGNVWDMERQQFMAFDRRPKGGDWVGKVFRTDWKDACALYHPYDRVAAHSHEKWKEKYPSLVWDREHSIVDLLGELHKLLHSTDYRGVR